MKRFLVLLLVGLARANPINPILKDHGDHIVPQDPINPTIPLVNSADVIVPDVVDPIVAVAPSSHVAPVVVPSVESVAPIVPVVVEPVVAPAVVEPVAPVAEALLNSAEPKVEEHIVHSPIVAPAVVEPIVAPVEETVRSVVEPVVEEKVVVAPSIVEAVVESVAPKDSEVVAPSFNSVPEVPVAVPVEVPVVPAVAPVVIAPVESKEDASIDFEHAKKLVIEVVSELKQYLPNDEVDASPVVVAPVAPIVGYSAVVPAVESVVPVAAPEVKVPVVPVVDVVPAPVAPVDVPAVVAPVSVEAVDVKPVVVSTSDVAAPAVVVESVGTQRQQNQMTGLIDQVNRLSETIENNITDLVSRRRYVQAAVLRSLLSYVRRVRINLERLQNRLQSVADITQQAPSNPNAPARPAIPGTEFINSIRERLNRIQEEVMSVMSRIRTTFVPNGSSTPVPPSATQSAPVSNAVQQASIASAVGTIVGAGAGIPNVVNAQATSA